ncbi:hypothetical protein DNTS_031777 [Danionella cerebrum]|uniref:DUF4806 domain-containing protein n=1 Tax=Danionella cerebrum TaxID=2873325 RepID=A0A553MYR8_9TELE|nr:hypothetical protein DNTS_031777 [Danionella translucida]
MVREGAAVSLCWLDSALYRKTKKTAKKKNHNKEKRLPTLKFHVITGVMYHIVQFVGSGDTEIVPSSWVKDGRSFWPPFKLKEKCSRAVMRGDPPDETWASYSIKIKETKNTFSEAWMLLPGSMLTSDVQTDEEDEDDRRRASRKKKRSRVFKKESESEEDNSDVSDHHRRKNPRGSTEFKCCLRDRQHEEVLSEILSMLETIKQQQQMILLQLESKGFGTLEVMEVSGFPLSSIEEMVQIEEVAAAQVDYRQKLINYFGLAGGTNVKETVWRIMSKLMTNQLARQINWRGVNGKYGFEQLVIKDIVLKSVRKNRNTSGALDGEIEKFIKRWLQLAADRDGGRKERALKQNNSS